MGFFDNVENISKGIDSLNDKMGDVKDTTKDVLTFQKKGIKLTRNGERMMNADAYALGHITLEELVKREEDASFDMTLEEFNKLSLREQQKIYDEHPEKVRILLGK